MDERRLRIAGRTVCVGYLLLLLSSFDSLVNLGGGVFDAGFKTSFEVLLDPVGWLLALAGWWSLTQLSPVDAVQRGLMVAAYWAFAIQFSLVTVVKLTVTGLPLTRLEGFFWLSTLGYASAAVGFGVAATTVSRFPSSRPESSVPALYRPSRILIFVGYAVIAASVVMSARDNITSLFFSQANVTSVVDTFLSPVGAVFGAVGWWFLCHFNARSARQQALIANGYLALGLALAVGAIERLLTISQMVGPPELTRWMWLEACGDVLGAIGFLLAFRQRASAGATAQSAVA